MQICLEELKEKRAEMKDALAGDLGRWAGAGGCPPIGHPKGNGSSKPRSRCKALIMRHVDVTHRMRCSCLGRDGGERQEEGHRRSQGEN